MDRAYVLSTSTEEVRELNLHDEVPGWTPQVGPMWPRDPQSIFHLQVYVAGEAWEKRRRVIQIWNNEGQFLTTVPLPGFGSPAKPGTEGSLWYIDNSQRFYVLQFKDDKPFTPLSIHVYEEKGTLLAEVKLQLVYPNATMELFGLRDSQIYVGVAKREKGTSQIREGIVQIYDLKSGELKGTLPHPLLWLKERMDPKPKTYVEKVRQLTNDGRVLFTVHRADRWELWEVTPGP
jgi:hypothetical protein